MSNSSGTKCVKCDNTRFEFVQDSPANSNYNYQYVRCSSCKTIISILPHSNTNAILSDIEKDIIKIKKKLMIS